MDNQIKEWLLKYAFLMLKETNTDTISDALVKIVSDPCLINSYHNLYDKDMNHIYTTWELLSDDDQDKITIIRITNAQLIILNQEKNTKNT